jgi:hypothetical protein
LEHVKVHKETEGDTSIDQVLNEENQEEVSKSIRHHQVMKIE